MPRVAHSHLLFLSLLAVFRLNSALISHQPIRRPYEKLSKTETKMSAASLSQFAPAAASLFNNMKTPASILAGSMVPLGFLTPLPVIETDSETKKVLDQRLRKIHMFIAVVSLCSELIAVMWATVAVNQLTETIVAPAESVWHLLQRDFNLEWLAVNSHFVIGMFGFMSMLGIRVYLSAIAAGFQITGANSVLSMATAGLLLMVSIVNRGVAAGEGGRYGWKFGGSVVSLISGYVHMFFKRALTPVSFGPVEIASFGFSMVSLAFGVKSIREGNAMDKKDR